MNLNGNKRLNILTVPRQYIISKPLHRVRD